MMPVSPLQLQSPPLLMCSGGPVALQGRGMQFRILNVDKLAAWLLLRQLLQKHL